MYYMNTLLVNTNQYDIRAQYAFTGGQANTDMIAITTRPIVIFGVTDGTDNACAIRVGVGTLTEIYRGGGDGREWGKGRGLDRQRAHIIPSANA